jgi:phospholipase/carboxylesterase
MLETIEVQTGAKPNAAVIWLHGLGADAHDFEPIVPELVRPGERAWRFVFPNAPVRPITINGGARMRAWYDIRNLDRTAGEDAAGFRDSDAHIRQIIANEIERGIAADRIVLAGFSQGGAVSLYTAPRLSESLAGVMALSCYLPLHGEFSEQRAAANDATPIFMAHGQQDQMLPLSMGLESRDFLKNHGYTVEWHAYPMAHAVCAAEIADIREFLLRTLP